jgi:hypothetical protein
MDWPELSWEVPPHRREWLSQRVRELSDLAYRFDVAIEEALKAGTVDAAELKEPFDAFRYQSSLVYVYLQMEAENATPSADEIPIHAEELQKTDSNLRRLRQEVLDLAGEQAEKIEIAEAAVPAPGAKLLMAHAGVNQPWPPPELQVPMLPKRRDGES